MTAFNFSQNLKTIVAFKIPSAKEIEHFYLNNSNKITADNFMSFIENKISLDFFSQKDIDMKPVNIYGMLKNIEDNLLDFEECNVLEAITDNTNEARFKIQVNSSQALRNILKKSNNLHTLEVLKLVKIMNLIQNPEIMNANLDQIFKRKKIDLQNTQMTNV